MRIRDWFRKKNHTPTSPLVGPAKYDSDLAEDRQKALESKQEARQQVSDVHELRDKSDKVHRGMKAFREDNHFGPWLLRTLRG